MIPGSRYSFQIGYHCQSGLIEKLILELDPETEEIVKKNPRFLPNKVTGVILVTLDNRCPMEKIDNFDCYARFQIIEEFSVVAYGKILELAE